MTTNNHDLNAPEQGTLDWDQLLNTNFQQIDTDVEIRDLEANIDQYTPKQGAKFFATDTGVRYLGDGNQWTVIPSQKVTKSVAQPVSSDPDNPVSGTMWYRQDLDEVRVQAGSSIKTLAPVQNDTDTSGTPIIQSSFDTQTEIEDFWVNVKSSNHGYKTAAVSSPTADGGGSMRVNFPGGEFYGGEFYHYIDDMNLDRIHLRYHSRLDGNFDIDNPWAGHQMGKAGIGLDGRYGNDLSDQGGADGTNGWLVNMSVWSGGERGVDDNKWFMTPYVYHADQGGKYGDTFWVDDSAAMERDKWYQHDIYFKMQSGVDTDDGVLRVWNDGNLVLDEQDFNWAWESPHDTIEAIRALHYYGGGWGAPDGSGDNHIYHDNLQVFDSEQSP